MQPNIFCPVPEEQRPLEEFRQLCDSWFFSWTIDKKKYLYKFLFSAFLLNLPISVLVESGSWELKHNITKFAISSFVYSWILPLLSLIRLLLGWNYIYRRLISEKIEYEESGWYDGQIWDKPVEWREREFLIAQHEVKPLILIISRYLVIIIGIIIIGLLICLGL